MIQFRRGSTKNWRATTQKLASGQPGYDKDKHKIKVGDGESTWTELPYASGLFEKEILDSESNAKSKQKIDSEDKTLITYGTEVPNASTVGQVYLQQYNAEPEVDYIVSSGINGIWTYQKWKSGIARCCGQVSLTTALQTSLEGSGLFQDANKMTSIEYPFSFIELPTETATVQSPGGIVLLANKGKNTTTTSGVYTILSLDEQLVPADYTISLQVEGLWR